MNNKYKSLEDIKEMHENDMELSHAAISYLIELAEKLGEVEANRDYWKQKCLLLQRQ